MCDDERQGIGERGPTPRDRRRGLDETRTQRRIVGAVHAQTRDQFGGRVRHRRFVGIGIGVGQRVDESAVLGGKGLGECHQLSLVLGRLDPARVAGYTGHPVMDLGELDHARRCDEECVDDAHLLVSGGALHGQRRLQRLVGGEDLLHVDEPVTPDIGPQAP